MASVASPGHKLPSQSGQGALPPFAIDTVLVQAFHRTLREVCFTERHSARVCRRVGGKTHSAAVRNAMREQQIGNARRVANLHRVFGMIGKRARSETCAPIRQLTMEMECHVASADTDADNDAVLISWSQQLDHYWLGRYGILKDWSGKLGLSAVEEALEETLRDIRDVTARLDKVADDIAEDSMDSILRLTETAKSGRPGVFAS